VPAVRIQDVQRTHVLRAVEAGARIVLAPMINTPDQAREFVRHGKYAPLGERGFNMNSRGAGYGVTSAGEAFAQANARTHFFAQVETLESAKNVEAICGVEGLAGIFVGPGDLSTAMGKCAQFGDPEVIGMITDVISRARKSGRHAGIMAAPGPLHDACLAAGADLFYFGSELAILIKAARAMLESVGHERLR
jgi:4-hydroxy-2-oxoheptanedioate aldolase